MKKLQYILVCIILAGLFTSCEDELDNPVLDNSQIVAPVFTAPSTNTTMVLLEDNDTVPIQFAWDKTIMPLDNLADPNYSLQFALKGKKFADFVEVAYTTDSVFNTTVGGLNEALIAKALGTDTLKHDTAYSFEVRIGSSIVDNSEYDVAYSNIVDMTLTLYIGKPDALWVPGEYQGWAPDKAPNLWSVEKNGIFTGFVYFPETSKNFKFKFSGTPNWDAPNYGDGGTGKLDTDGGDLTVPKAGGYFFTVNVNKLTWEYEAQSWGIIGTFNEWKEDIDMTWDATNGYLTVDQTFAAGDQLKFRANDDWAVNYGDKEPDGILDTQDDNNINIAEAGDYTVILDFSSYEPKYQLIKK
ncbi:MAG: SusE domain-containing protein [Bacteroidales bacterium]|nr:SusE domain-containing protein [Bacteroidales bacterium]